MITRDWKLPMDNDNNNGTVIILESKKPNYC